MKKQSNDIKLQPAQVLYVVDGDTLSVKYNGKTEKIRLIGVDTPESVNPDESKNCKQGKIASDYTKSIIKKDQTIYLEFDNEQYDKYNRMLTYVWLQADADKDNMDANMLNAKLLKMGYATTLTIVPNTRYKNEFNNIKNKAKQNNSGFWTDKGELGWN